MYTYTSTIDFLYYSTIHSFSTIIQYQLLFIRTYVEISGRTPAEVVVFMGPVLKKFVIIYIQIDYSSL